MMNNIHLSVFDAQKVRAEVSTFTCQQIRKNRSWNAKQNQDKLTQHPTLIIFFQLMFEQYKKTSVLLVFHVFRSTEIRKKRSPPVILAWTPSVTTLRLRARNRTGDNLNKTKKGGRNDGKHFFLDSANTCNYFLQSQGH